MYDLTMYDVQLIVEIACKITKKIRITQVLSYKFLIFANKFAYLAKKSYLCSRSCVRYKMTNEIVLYQPNDQLSIEVKLENETVWLTQQQMAMLFNTTRNNITLHIGNIFKEGELDKDSVCKESLLTADIYSDGLYKTLRDTHNASAGVQPINTHKWSTASHDRWLIVDDRLYHCGHSVKDLGKKLSAIMLMGESPEAILNHVR